MVWARLGQVHATAALAAATTLRGDLAHGLPRPDWEEWNDIAGAKPPETPEEPSS